MVYIRRVSSEKLRCDNTEHTNRLEDVHTVIKNSLNIVLWNKNYATGSMDFLASFWVSLYVMYLLF
jgi:hypothetical protein